MCVEAKIDLPRFSVLTPFPGTELYRKLESAGRITERDWSLYDVEHVVFRPAQMTAAELEAGIARAWKKAYSLSLIHISPMFLRSVTSCAMPTVPMICPSSKKRGDLYVLNCRIPRCV